jgi:peroxiredoxin
MLPLTIYASTTCEDTALVTDRPQVLGVPFAIRYRQDDKDVDDVLKRWNGGNLVTPTLVFGNEELAAAEPTVQKLEEILSEAGYIVEPPKATEVRGALKNQRLPNFTLPATNGTDLTLYKLRKRAVLFFAHAADERVCQGYARQLTRQRQEFDEYNAQPLLILRDSIENLGAWAKEFANGYAALADAEGKTKARYATELGLSASDVFLVVLDTYYAPRAYSVAADAGGLIAPSEVFSWLRLLDCECDE